MTPGVTALAAGSWTATVAADGGGLASLRYEGHDVVVPQDGEGGHPTYRGAVLAPWPNRLEDGAYAFDGHAYQLPVNEPEGATALHGLVVDVPWRVVEAAADAVRLTVEAPRLAGYPFDVRLDVAYELAPSGLDVTLTAVNEGDGPAPYGCGFHPYLTLDEGDDTVVGIDAARYLESTPDRLLPLRVRDVAGSPYDFRTPRPLGATALDTPYAGLGERVVRVGRTTVTLGEGVRWLQAYTPDDRRSLAVEPCTSPANSFRTGDDLVVLPPGGQHVLSWALSRT